MRGIPILTALLSTGCCIPFPSEDIVFPAAQVVVTSGDKPLAGATVRVVRYDGYYMPETTRERAGEADGRGSFVSSDTREKINHYPLMMHGVPRYHWQICAEAPGHRAQVRDITEDVWTSEGPIPVELRLQPGAGPACEELFGSGATISQPPAADSVHGADAPASDVGPRLAPPTDSGTNRGD